jgi:hypothetical protein
MTTAIELAALMDDRASRLIAGNENAYQVGIETAAFDHLHDADPGADAPSAALNAWFYISELADAPWGPQSMDQCEATFVSFAGAWAALENKTDPDVQTAFFDDWTKKAQDLIRRGRRFGWKRRQKRLIQRKQIDPSA